MPKDPTKDALKASAEYWAAVDELRAFEAREPNNSGKEWDKRFSAVDQAETAARAALKKIPTD